MQLCLPEVKSVWPEFVIIAIGTKQVGGGGPQIEVSLHTSFEVHTSIEVCVRRSMYAYSLLLA